MTDLSAYLSFLASKQASKPGSGIRAPVIHPRLFPFQRDIVRWALRLERAAVFADTGLGKTAMQLAWAEQVIKHTDMPVLILTPLAVAAQTVREAEVMGLCAMYVKQPSDIPVNDNGQPAPGIYVTNYDRLHLFSPHWFAGIILDESSILKDHTSATRTALIEAFSHTPFRLACTATPSPNDFTELGNHAEFLGVMKRTEMLSMFFSHDGGSTQDWRLKGHAKEAFWKWVSSWAVMIKKPSDLGYLDDGYDLPPIKRVQHVVNIDVAKVRAREIEQSKKGSRKKAVQIPMFVETARTLNDQRWARKETIEARVNLAAEIIAGELDEAWLVWVDLNDEGDEIERALRDKIQGAVQIAGSDTPEFKEANMLGFCSGQPRILISKPRICGAGMNFQHCARMIFIGLSHSFERLYQAERRCHRFGQKRRVEVHIVTSDAEGHVLDNIARKQAEAEEMSRAMVKHVRCVLTDEGGAGQGGEIMGVAEVVLPDWIREAL